MAIVRIHTPSVSGLLIRERVIEKDINMRVIVFVNIGGWWSR